jgi:hypothetical protein
LLLSFVDKMHKPRSGLHAADAKHRVTCTTWPPYGVRGVGADNELIASRACPLHAMRLTVLFRRNALEPNHPVGLEAPARSLGAVVIQSTASIKRQRPGEKIIRNSKRHAETKNPHNRAWILTLDRLMRFRRQ